MKGCLELSVAWLPRERQQKKFPLDYYLVSLLLKYFYWQDCDRELSSKREKQRQMITAKEWDQ